MLFDGKARPYLFVTLTDYANFAGGLLGPTSGLDSGCNCFDMDRDADLDLVDFAMFTLYFNGPGHRTRRGGMVSGVVFDWHVWARIE